TATDYRNELPNTTSTQISITGFGTLGGDAGRPRLYEYQRFQLADNVSLTAGAHRWRFGVDVNLNKFHQVRESNIQGRYDFTSLANYVKGTVSRFRQTVSVTDPDALNYRARGQELAFFAQDKFNLRRNLTVSAGLRWEGQWNPQPPRPNP